MRMYKIIYPLENTNQKKFPPMKSDPLANKTNVENPIHLILHVILIPLTRKMIKINEVTKIRCFINSPPFPQIWTSCRMT